MNRLTKGEGLFGKATTQNLTVGSGTNVIHLFFLSAQITPTATLAASAITHVAHTTGLGSINNSDIILGMEPVTAWGSLAAAASAVTHVAANVTAASTVTVSYACPASSAAVSANLPTDWRIVGIRFTGS